MSNIQATGGSTSTAVRETGEPLEAASENLGIIDASTGDLAEFGGLSTSSEASTSVRRGLTLMLVVLASLTGLVCWLGVQAFDSTQELNQRALFIETGRQGALRLTTISDTEVDSKVKELLDSSTGPFHEDFQKRSASFVETVKRTQSRTVGTVVEAGLESVAGDRANVLVAVSVKTSLAGAEAPPRLWRMRIGVQKVGQEAKVSNVEFVP